MLFLVEILDFKKGNWTEVKPTKYIMNRYMEFTANSQSLTETMYNCMCFISNDCRNSFKEHSPIRRVRLFKNMEKSYDLLYSFDLHGNEFESYCSINDCPRHSLDDFNDEHIEDILNKLIEKLKQ